MKATLLLLALCALAAGPAQGQEQPRKGGTLVFALTADIRSLDPGILRDGNIGSVVSTVVERLVAFAELHVMAADQVPILGIYYDTGLAAAGPRVRGFTVRPGGKPLPWGVWKAG